MARILFIGDPHLKITKFDVARQFLSWLDTTIYELQPDLVVCLGDTFDTHAVVRSEIMNEYMDHVKFITKSFDYVYLLGNHDMFKPSDAKYHALKHIKGTIDKFHVIDTVTELYDITWVPYQVSPDTFPTKTKDICVAHQTFKGADYGDITVQEGVDFDNISADVIISGHIHKKQILGKVIYPGSPFPQSVNDINQVKGVMMFNTETYRHELIPSPLPMWKGLRFEITPAFTCDQMFEEIQTDLNDKDHWIIEITGPKAEIIGFLDSKRVKNLFDGKDVKIKSNFTDKEKKLASIKALSVESIVAEYIDKVYSGALDKAELKNKSIELLSKVNAS